MTTGRINQVEFLLDVRPAWSSTHYLGRGEAITGRAHRSCRGTRCTSYERPGPRPYAHEIFCIQKHDRASMHRRGRIMPIDTLGTPGTTEVHQAATRNFVGGKEGGGVAAAAFLMSTNFGGLEKKVRGQQKGMGVGWVVQQQYPLRRRLCQMHGH
ncbi:hypothetical protein V6N13_081684 [Hibiscus sabdariffa]